MNEIEKIQKYIKKTGVTYPPTTPYQMNMMEVFELRHMGDVSGAICLAFAYGRAKGERSARATQRKGATE